MTVPESTPRTARQFDAEMVAVAKRRGIVRLSDGTLATLVSWGISRGERNEPKRARFEGCDGQTRWTGSKTDVVEVVQ